MQGRLRRDLVATLGADEAIDFRLMASTLGGVTQALLATPTRIIIGKAGPTAGATLGSIVTSFRYGDINSIEVRKGPVNGWIEILTSSYQASPGVHFWSTDETTDPYRRPNCMPAPWGAIQSFRPFVEKLRQRTASAHDQRDGVSIGNVSQPAPSATTSLPSQLRHLAELHGEGVLSDEEFTRAKQYLLSSHNV